jgi:hypothetical protein
MKWRKVKEMEIKIIKEHTGYKLQIVTVGYTSGGLMKEDIITFTIFFDLPNYSRRISHHKQRQFYTGFYHITFLTDIFELLVEKKKLYFQKYWYK